MHIHQTSSREEFLANRPVGMLIRVIRVPTTARKVRPGDNCLVTVPGIHFSYSFIIGDHAWTYHEKLLGKVNENPAILDLEHTLWAELERTGEYYLYPRAGSI
jgi:hypothetical protein